MNATAAKKKITQAHRIDEDANPYEGYSGRGMFGRVSAAAVVSGARPADAEGKRLLRVFGHVDSLGRDFIYYTSETLDAGSDDCEGHPAGAGDPMGQTVHCDGSCAAVG